MLHSTVSVHFTVPAPFSLFNILSVSAVCPQQALLEDLQNVRRCFISIQTPSTAACSALNVVWPTGHTALRQAKQQGLF